MLKVELYTCEIPAIFVRFRDIVGESQWLRRATSVKQDIKGHRFLKDHLVEENAIAFALTRCSELVNRYGCIPVQEISTRALYPAMSFAAQTLSILDRSSDQQKKKLIRRIHGALKNPEDMRAIQLEMIVATHFVRRGHTIIWPEMEGDGTFDLLIKNIGVNGLEVECKLATRDKGRRIHRREALEFHHLVRRRLEPVSRTLRSGLAVVLTVPGRLPTRIQEKMELAQRVIDQVLSAQSMAFNDGCHIRVSEFDVTALGDLGSTEHPTIPRNLANVITSTHNREVMVLGQRNGGAIAFALQSSRDDTMLKYIFNTLSESAKSQMSRKRPALLLVGLHELGTDELLNVAMRDFDSQQPPTALRVHASNFLASQERDHIVGVGFLSRDVLGSKLQGDIESGGTAYVFKKQESSFWHPDFSRLFS